MIISTSAIEFSEIESLVEVFKSTGNQDLTLLLCTSYYLAELSEAHIRRMKTLSDTFNVRVGLSDHTLGIGGLIAAIVLGTRAIEKHLTLKRSDSGADDGALSVEPSEFKKLIQEGNAAKSALGIGEWGIQRSEAESKRLRRPLYIVQDVAAGEIVTKTNVRAIRPGVRCSPSLLEEIVGTTFKNSYLKGTLLTFDNLEVN